MFRLLNLLFALVFTLSVGLVPSDLRHYSMSANTSCAKYYYLDQLNSINFYVSQIVDLVAIVITFFATYSAVKVVLSKSIFQLSTKVLLLQVLFYANLHQLSYGLEAVVLIYKGFFVMGKTCNILVSEATCAPYLKVLLAGITGMLFGQTGLILERACATFSSNYSGQLTKVIGFTISFVVFVCSAATGSLTLWDDPLTEYVSACFVFPNKSAARSNVYLMICMALTLINLIASLVIMRYNKQLEYSNRFQVGARFRKREAIDSTETICFLTLAEFIAMFVYSFGVFLLRNLMTIITMESFLFFIVWCYTVPFIAVLYPLLLIYRIRIRRANRVQKIAEITHAKQTQDDHINEINKMWS